MAMVAMTHLPLPEFASAGAPAPLTLGDIEKLSTFRTGLRQYLQHSHLFCEIFDLTDLQYVFLLTVKALDAQHQATYRTLKAELSLTDSVLTKLVRRSLKSDLLTMAPAPLGESGQCFRLSTAGDRLIATLAALHKKEFERFQTRFTRQCDTHCESPICWKGSD